MLERWRRLTPKKQLRIYSIIFASLTALIFVLVFTSLAITASNLMITNELATDSQEQALKNDFPLYLVSQNGMVAIDVTLLFFLPLLAFSVFTFYTKGNFIIVIFLAVLNLLRLVFGMMFLIAGSSQKDLWNNLWQITKQGTAPECNNQSCGDNMINYVMCGKLTLWHQLTTFQQFFCGFWTLLSIFQLIVAILTNRLDTELSQLEEDMEK